MKALLLTAFALASLPLLAQTSPTTSTTSTTTTSTTSPTAPAAPPSQQEMMQQVMSSLTPAEKDQLTTARTKAIADNPTLQTKGMDLMQKGMALQSGAATDADKEAFRAAAMSYGKELRAAMVKADPTIEPVLQKIQAAELKLQAEYAH